MWFISNNGIARTTLYGMDDRPG